jgi:hypothetical protein
LNTWILLLEYWVLLFSEEFIGADRPLLIFILDLKFLRVEFGEHCVKLVGDLRKQLLKLLDLRVLLLKSLGQHPWAIVRRYIFLVHADHAVFTLDLSLRAGFEVLEEVVDRFWLIAVPIGTLQLSVWAFWLQVLDDIIVPKSLLLRGAHRTEEDNRGQFSFEHLVEVTEFGILLLAIFVGTFPQGALGPRTVYAVQTSGAITWLAFLCLLKNVRADYALVKHLGLRFVGLGYQIHGKCHLLRDEFSYLLVSLCFQLLLGREDNVCSLGRWWLCHHSFHLH